MIKVFGQPKAKAREDAEHWMSVSDLMAGLMMVFLFISIALMRYAFIERDRIREVAVAYQENQIAIYQALMDEFEADLPEWDAEIDEDTLAFWFRSPDILFDSGSIALKPKFQMILQDFFPRYLTVLEGFKESISEVKIEGHTSSPWNVGSTEDEAYFNNMYLSQGRTREVLRFVYGLESTKPYLQWVRGHVAAVGYSSSRLIRNPDGTEDRDRSRRVMFKVVTNAEIQIRKILEG